LVQGASSRSPHHNRRRGSSSIRRFPALAEGKVFIQYRAENLRIELVFGPKALEVSPRIGHIHVSVDGAPWHWADASGEPLILVGLPAGPHSVEIILANANHQPLDCTTLSFSVPTLPVPSSHHSQ
jgi:hypothetical protein